MIITEEQSKVVGAALGVYLGFLASNIKGRDIEDNEELFALMSLYSIAGDLWIDTLKFQGVDPREIKALLADTRPDLDPDYD